MLLIWYSTGITLFYIILNTMNTKNKMNKLVFSKKYNFRFFFDT